MATREPVETKNLDIYGDAVLPWSRPRDVLHAIDPKAHITWFLGTAGADGRPHAAGVGALWVDGDLYFTSGDGTKKSKDLKANPFASIGVSLEGMDLVFEGTVERVTDGPTLDAVVKAYNDSGWPATVEGDAFTAPFSAPSAGPPPWALYRLAFDRVIAVASAEPYGATSWRFA
ncbi:MAG: pyridoxamine 5'-phosphate oxidase family protein [Chloroflexota bacterium]